MTAVPNIAKLRNALPFWLSLTLLPIVVYAAITGGWALILPVAATLGCAQGFDAVLLTDIQTPQATYEALRTFLPDDRILAPQVLRVTRRPGEADG